jgi:3-oxoacyl-[acyl-carrier protein] reductase
MENSSQRVAIVTGASRGIGAATARRLAADGLAIAVNYAGSAQEASAVAGEITKAGGKAIAVKADVSDAAAVTGLFDAVRAAYGGVDVLVNNAGLMKLATIAKTDDALFDRHVAVNLKGTFNTLREAARTLRDGGRIINLSSSMVRIRQPEYGVYAATKAGVEAFAETLRKEVADKNIKVSVIQPGSVATPMQECSDDDKRQAIADHEMLYPEEIAEAIHFALTRSERADVVNLRIEPRLQKTS